VPDAWLARLKAALRRVSNQHPELGYPKVTRLLKNEGWKVGTRLVQRLRRELGLAVPARKSKKRRQGVSTGLATKATHRPALMNLRLRSRYDSEMRQATDAQYHRQVYPGIAVHLCGSADQRPYGMPDLSELIDLHGAPEHIRSDNDSVFIEKDLRAWLADNQIKTLYI
jgi:transposase InsO family protein